VYDIPAFEAALTGTIYAGELHFSPVTGSTNSDAIAGARNDAPHGSVYFADEQTAGRGRGDHRWESDAGQGLYVSVLLRLALPAGRYAASSIGGRSCGSRGDFSQSARSMWIYAGPTIC
jgi:BirA family biotin operon repressor/biotin-[acetyl-CoA-carboxylase] ligase